MAPLNEDKSVPDRSVLFWGIVVFSFCAIRTLGLPFTQSLFLDETLTSWLSSDSAAETQRRVLAYHSQSPLYYWIILFVKEFIGSTEIVLRLPSFLFFLGASYCLYLFCAEYFGEHAGLVAVFAFFADDYALFHAWSARPYALGMLLSLLSMLCLARWAKGEGTLNYSLWIVSTALTVYAHYFLGLILVVQAIYLITVERTVSRKRTLAALKGFALIAVLLFPCVSHLNALSGKAGNLSYAPIPTVSDLLAVVFSPMVIGIFLSSLAVLAWFRRELDWKMVKPKDLVFPLLWYLIPPLIFFLYSVVTQRSLFIPRYFVEGLPGISVFFGGAFAMLRPSKMHVLVLLLFSILKIGAQGLSPWELEPWREASMLVNAHLAAPNEPVILFSGFIESENQEWLNDPEKKEYLKAPLLYYRTNGDAVIVPSSIEGKERTFYFAKEIAPLLENNNEVLFVSFYKEIFFQGKWIPVYDYYQRLFAQRGFTATELLKGSVSVFQLKRNK